MKNTNTRNFDDRRAKRNTPLHGRNSFIKSHRFKSEVSLAAQLVTTRGPARERGAALEDPEADGSSFVETLSGNGQPHELAKPWDDHGNNSKGYIGRLAQDESHGCRKEECASGRSTLAMIMDQVPTDSFHAGKYEDIELFRITLTDRGESH
ncbi:Ribosome biogenesis protein [Trichinella pseudospiralis]